jgi:hypothetical protein
MIGSSDVLLNFDADPREDFDDCFKELDVFNEFTELIG